MLDIIGQIFFLGIFATPVLAFFWVRKLHTGLAWKLFGGFGVTIALALTFFFIAMAILLRNGLGPT
jgi:hypothetical protein